MKKLYLTLALLTLLTLIIISGCGGGSGTTQPASLTTPVPNNSGNKAYITIKIKWPEEGMTGSFVISPGNNKEITASMPDGSLKLKTHVFDYTDKDPNALIDFNDTSGLLASGIADRSQGEITLEIPLESAIARHLTGNVYLAPFPVKIWAGAFGASGDPNNPNSALIATEQYVELEVGPQLVTIPLGDYELTLTADPNNIVLGGSTVSGSSLISNAAGGDMTPTPGIVPAGTSDITATLSIKYPGDPNVPNSMPVYKPVAHKEVQFTLTGGGELSAIRKDTNEGTGNCTVTLTTTEPGLKTITARFQADPNDPNTIYTDTCDVNVTGNPNLELYELTLKAAPNSSNKFILIPDFQSDDYNLVDSVTLRAELMKLDPNTFQFNIPASKPIDVTVTDNNNTTHITGTTGSDGYYCFDVSYNGDMTHRTIGVQASFHPDPNEEAKTATLPVIVENNQVISENFEIYPPGTTGTTSISGWENYHGIVATPGYESSNSILLHQNNFFYTNLHNSFSYEYRFAVKIGNEDPNGYDLPIGGIICHGLWKNGSSLKVLTLKNKSIENCNGETLTSYSSGWTPIKIQINYDEYTNTAKINYWINGGHYGPVNANDVSSSSENIWYGLLCWAGSIMFDNIEIYSSAGLINKN
jgi:hypothetical protein